LENIKFNKTICGVDFLLNILDYPGTHLRGEDGVWRSADFFQILFINEAEGELRVNHKVIRPTSQSILFISQHQKHLWETSQKLDAKILVFQEGFLNEFFADKLFSFRLLYFYQTEFPLLVQSEPDFYARMIKLLREIQHELRFPKSDSVHIIRSLVYYLLMQLNRLYAKTYGIDCAISVDNTAYRFRMLLEQKITTMQRIDEYASALEVSRVALNAAVKRQFNVTASELLKQRLIHEVKNYLIHTNKTIAEISEELHFSEPNHLSRLFKQKEGLSPSQFRQQLH